VPTLHRYQDRDGYYVLTSIGGKIVTYQLNAQGADKLLGAGAIPDRNPKFARALLLDLIRTGDAFTGGAGVDQATAQAENQLELDFPADPDPDTAFPVCDDCASREGLHLVLTRATQGITAKLACADHRLGRSAAADTSIPLELVSLPLFGRLFEIKTVKRRLDGVSRFEKLLRTAFESKWEEFRKSNRPSQTGLFEGAQSGELNLSPRPSKK
jgi:hypothetical protein